MVGLLDDGYDLDGREGGLPATLVVERADAHEAVGAGLNRERAVGVGNLDGKGRGLEPSLFRVRRVVHLGRIPVPLRPPQVHPQQHLGEVGRVHPARPGADGHQRLAGVVLAGEQRPYLELVDRLTEGHDLDGHLGCGVRVGLRLRQPVHELGVIQSGAQPLDPVDLALDIGEARRDHLSLRGVVPKVRSRGLSLELRLLLAHPVGRAQPMLCGSAEAGALVGRSAWSNHQKYPDFGVNAP
jgi:hypothetical protein